MENIKITIKTAYEHFAEPFNIINTNAMVDIILLRSYVPIELRK